MLAVGLTGGIGAGKSTVADMLVDRGAVLVDADRIAREVVERGAPAYRALVDRFGPGVVGPDASLDRAALAGLVFGDPEALADLNAITHPAIGAAMLERKARFDGSDAVVVLDIPLLRDEHRSMLSLDVVVVVDAPTATALDRLTGVRGMPAADAAARMAAQPDRSARLAVADIVIDNSGDLAHLTGEVDRAWRALEALRRVRRDP